MKKLLFMFAGLALLFTACNMAIPESVSVKTDADYNFSIGDINKDFNDTFKVSELFKDLETQYNKIYDYFPGQENTKLQQFLLTVATPDIPMGITLPAGEEGKSLADYGIPSLPFSGSVEVKMNMKEIFNSFKVLGDEFAEKVDFADLPVYVYCNIGSGFSETAMTGRIKVETAKGEKYIIGDAASLADFTPNASPVLKNAEEEPVVSGDTVVTDVSKTPFTACDEKNMTAFLNANKDTENGFTLSYEIEIDNEETIFDGNPIGDIKISIFVGLPLKFKVSESSDLDIDLISLSKTGKGGTDKDKDIFNRDKATDISDIKKYLDVVEKVVIGYKNRKNPFIADSSEYVIGSDYPPIPVKRLDPDKDEVEVTHDEFILMLETYPYTPTAVLQITKGSAVSLPRGIALDINTYVRVSTNGTIKF